MDSRFSDLEARVALLERSLQRTRAAVIAPIGALVLIGVMAAARPAVQNEVITRRLSVVDDKGRERVVIAQDPVDSQRRSRGVGFALMDSTGSERGGFTTMDDGSVVLGLDAPTGVGSPMGDRIGLWVDADGSADVMVLDNLTRVVTKLHSDADGNGGFQLFRYDLKDKKVQVRTIGYDGERHQTLPIE